MNQLDYGSEDAVRGTTVLRTARILPLAFINTLGAFGGLVGTYGVGSLHAHTHNYKASFASLSISLAASGILTLVVRTRRMAITS